MMSEYCVGWQSARQECISQGQKSNEDMEERAGADTFLICMTSPLALWFQWYAVGTDSQSSNFHHEALTSCTSPDTAFCAPAAGPFSITYWRSPKAVQESANKSAASAASPDYAKFQAVIKPAASTASLRRGRASGRLDCGQKIVKILDSVYCIVCGQMCKSLAQHPPPPG